MSAQQNQLKDLTEEEFVVFTSSYSYTPVGPPGPAPGPGPGPAAPANPPAAPSQSALQFLEAYGHEDVTVAELQGSSNSLWTISPPSRQYLSQVLNLDQFPLTMSWTIQR